MESIAAHIQNQIMGGGQKNISKANTVLKLRIEIAPFLLWFMSSNYSVKLDYCC